MCSYLGGRSIVEIRSHLDNDFPEVLSRCDSFKGLRGLIEGKNGIDLGFDRMLLDKLNEVLEVCSGADIDSVE